MDFTPALLAFQGALTSADNVHNFSRVNSKGGNEEKVNYVVATLRRFLEAQNCIDEVGLIDSMLPNTRKFVLYIILNTNLPVIQDLMDITELEPFIWSIPTVSQYLMCEIIWQLHLEKIIYELISSSWPQLGIEVAEAFLINFKYFNPTECLNKLLKLCKASYAVICKLTCFTLQNEDDTLANIFDILQKYLHYYTNPPNEHKLDTLSTDELYKYKGHCLQSMLLLVLECCDLFTQKIDFNNDDPLYKLTYSEECIKISMANVCDSSNKAVLECLNNSNIVLLDTFKAIVMDISVDIFCAWSEFEDQGKSMQQTLGELCHKVQTKLLSINSIAEHPVVGMLQLMARKPTDVNDIIDTVDTNFILEKINSNNEDSELWMHALVNKKDLSEHNALIDIIDSKLNMFNDKECLKLFNKIKNTKADDNVRKEFLICLTIKLFNKCNSVDKHIILKEHFSDKILVDIDRPAYDFNGILTEIFNKLSADTDVDLEDVLALFYQRPGEVYAKIFGLAAQNNLLINPMLKMMILLKDYMDYYYSSDTHTCVIKNMKNMLNCCLDTKSSNNILKFICELKNNDIVSSSQLLLLVIMPGIHDALILKHITKLHVHVKLLITAYSMEELSSYRAPIIVAMAQILMTVRNVDLDLNSFEQEALETIETVIKFLKTIIVTYNDQFVAQEVSWMRQKLLKLNLYPLNIYYFKCFWNKTNMILFESMTEHPIQKDNLDVLAIKLKQILPWIVLDEWGEIWDSFIEKNIRKKDVLHIFHRAMRSLTEEINAHRNKNTLASMFYCYRNFVHIIRYKYFEEPLEDSQVKFCISLLAKNLESVMCEDYNKIDSIIMPLFSYLTEKGIDFHANVVSCFVNSRFMAIVNKFVPIENIN